jgi:thymidylate synthase ThyX
MEEFKVTLLSCTENPQTLSVAGALGCFEEQSSVQIMRELQALSVEDRLKKEKGVLKNSFGRGHGSVGDQNAFVFSIENLPRAATFQLCLPEYLSHLQQSLRRAKADRGFYLPEVIKKSKLGQKTQETLAKGFDLYGRMTEAGIPGEDARFPLSLYTKTNIQTITDARELCHAWKMSQGEKVPSVVRAVVNEMLALAKAKAPYLFEDFGFNYQTISWLPSAQLYSSSNHLISQLVSSSGNGQDVALISKPASSLNDLVDQDLVERAVRGDETELANLKKIHFEFLIKMSLACLHQAIRQRTWDHSLESIYEAVITAAVVKEKRMALPASIRDSAFAADYRKQHQDIIDLYLELIKSGIPIGEAIGVIPHSLQIYTLVHINGWNAIHAIGQRTCTEAQWEIRHLSRQIAQIIKKEMPALGKWCEPQCIALGQCPEIKDCGYYKKKPV